MSFKVRKKEDIGSGLKRILGEQLVTSSRLLIRTGLQNSTVHQVRKSTKRIRAILYFLQPFLPKKRYSSLKKDIRSVARAFSGARDVFIVRQYLDNIGKTGKFSGKQQSINEVSKQLDDLPVHEERQQDIADVVDRLEDIGNRLNIIEPKAVSAEQCASRMADIYQQAWVILHENMKSLDVDRMHVLRKQVKMLWYATQLFQGIWPDYFLFLANQYEKLSENLGVLHDWVVVEQLLSAIESDAHSEIREELLRYALTQQEMIAKKALKEGELVFVESDSVYRKKLKKLFNQARQ